MTIPRVLTTLCLVALAGCQMLGRGSMAPPTPAALLTFSAKVKASAERLETLEKTSPPAFSESAREDVRNAVADLREHLEHYQNLVAELNDSWETRSPADLLDALAKSETVTKTIVEKSADIELVVDTLESELASPAEASAPTRDYLAVCRKLVALSEKSTSSLARIHLSRLEAKANVAPQEKTFHFLRLHDIEDERLSRHTEAYREACAQWLTATLKRGELAESMEILALVAAAAPAYAPKSPQKLFEVSYATLERILPLSTVERLENALAKIRLAVPRLANGAGWKRAVTKATARLKLARAQAMEVSAEAVLLAAEALELESQLAVNVSSFLVASAPRLALPYANAHDYPRALTVFKETLSVTAIVPQARAQYQSFRARLVARGAAEATSEVTFGRFAKSRTIIEQVAKIAKTRDEKREVSEALRDYYVGYTGALLRRDLEQALAVSREAREVFPDDPKVARQADSAIYLRLENRLGDLATTRTRIGAAGILRLLGSTVKQMITDEGAATCQELLARIEKIWRVQLDERKNPGEGFDIALQIAYLNRLGKAEARAQAARVVWKDFDESLLERDWRRLEACVETYFNRCPDLRRPASFKTGYLRYLKQLNATGQGAKLGRHRARFAAAYPNTPLNLSAGTSPVATRAAASGETPGADPASAAGSRTDWKEPAGLWKEPAPTAALASQAQARGPGATGIFLAFGSVAAVAALVVLTWKKGFLAFHWYAIGAFVVGTTLGFFWLRPPGAPQEAGVRGAAAEARPDVESLRRDTL